MSAPERHAPEHGELDLRHYLGVLRQQWVVIAVTVAVIVAVTLAMTSTESKLYRATSTILIEQPLRLTDDGGVNLQSSAMENEEAFFESPLMRAAVGEVYDGPVPLGQVRASASRGGADILTATVSASDPRNAEQVLDLYVTTFVETRRRNRLEQLLSISSEIENQISQLNDRINEIAGPLDDAGTRVEEAVAGQLDPLLRQRAVFEAQAQSLLVEQQLLDVGDATILGSAEASDDPVSPKPMRSLLAAIVAGLVVGTGLALIRDRMRAHSRRELIGA